MSPDYQKQLLNLSSSAKNNRKAYYFQVEKKDNYSRSKIFLLSSLRQGHTSLKDCTTKIAVVLPQILITDSPRRSLLLSYKD